MKTEDGNDAPVKARAILVDPETMTVLWANESAETGMPVGGTVIGGPAEGAIPLAARLDVVRAIERVASSGEPHHVHADVIPTRRGSMALAISIYRLPNGDVLVLVENVWEHAARR